MKVKMSPKRWGAVAVVSLLIFGGLYLVLMRDSDSLVTGKAGLSDLLDSRSERIEGAPTAAVTSDCAFYSMITTPVCEYYDGDRELQVSPMLVYYDQVGIPSNPANDFLDHYAYEKLIQVGDVVGLGHDPSKTYRGGQKVVSLAMATDHWSASDGAVLVDLSEEAYGDSMYGALLATYVNIPVIVTDSLDSRVVSVLEDLGVKYTIVCGDIDGYGKVMKFDTEEEAQEMTLDFIRHEDGFNTEPRYLTMANPMDAHELQYETVDQLHLTDEVFHIYTPGGGAYAGLEEIGEGVDYDYVVPDTVRNGILRFDLTFKPHEQDEIDGERIYCFIFYEDPDNGWEQKYYMGTCAGVKDGAYESVHFDVPVLGATGNYKFHVEGRNTYEIGSGNLLQKTPVPFVLEVQLDALASPIYPNMEMLSAVAPYQCGFHKGVLMSKEEYALQYPQLENETGALEPAVFESAHEYVNEQAWMVKDDQLMLLAKMAGIEDVETVLTDTDVLVEMADKFYSDPVYVSVVADTNMVPHYYHTSGSHPSEGCGQAGDIIYADIDMDRENPRMDFGGGRISSEVQDMELPIGRFAGYDVMDVSALIARSFFYNEIIDNYVGHGQDADKVWKDNGYVFLGSKMPVETMYGTYIRQVSDLMNDGNLDVIGTTEERSDYKLAHQFQEGSNYIFGGVHGNFYWYVPQCHIDAISGGSAYDVTNVLDMSMGPSTMFLVSCITGRIDGLTPENCLSMAYMHIGTTSYVGATRSTLGWIDPGLEFDMRPFEPEGAVLLSELYLQNLLEDQDTGMALRDAKNLYLYTDLASGAIGEESYIMVQHYVLYGDPAFNPYEP